MLRIAVVDNAERAREFCSTMRISMILLFQMSYFLDGAELLRNYQPIYDLIFLDIEMPKKDGMTAVREIRQIDLTATLVFVTKMGQVRDQGL